MPGPLFMPFTSYFGRCFASAMCVEGFADFRAKRGLELPSRIGHDGTIRDSSTLNDRNHMLKVVCEPGRFLA